VGQEALLVLLVLLVLLLLWHQLAHLLLPWMPRHWQCWLQRRMSGAALHSRPGVLLLGLLVRRGRTPPG
jgi:hypothetical protein